MGKKSNNALRQARQTPKEMRVMSYAINHKPKNKRVSLKVGDLVAGYTIKSITKEQ